MKDYSAKINRIKIQLDEIGKKEFEALGTFFSNDPITINCWSEQTSIPATTLHSRILRLIEKNPELSKHVVDVNNIIRVDKIIRNRILETPTDMMSLNDYFATEKMSAQEQRRVIGCLDNSFIKRIAWVGRDLFIFSCFFCACFSIASATANNLPYR